MTAPILTTKLYIPPPRIKVVARPRLLERVREGIRHKLTLISAPAGFGKSTLVSEWAAQHEAAVAWLSLDAGDNDRNRFLMYLVAALQTVAPALSDGLMAALQSQQPPPSDAILTALLNQLATIPDEVVLVLDDYHLIEAKGVEEAVAFLLEHLPPHCHVVIVTREDPQLPLSRLRARGQLTELRIADLRFTPEEAATFLNQVMGLQLSEANIAALERRTEGWVAGLQLAALSMQGHADPVPFIHAFTGSHRFVLDYLAEEVLQQQPASVQQFLLRTSILERLCAPLADALLEDPTLSGQASLAHIERANLFIIPLDNERRWYRYHPLFMDLLRQRLQRHAITHPQEAGWSSTVLHQRAAQWYAANGLDLEAFQHAVAAHDVDHAAQLVEGKGMPLIFRGAAVPVLKWLETLPAAELEARPVLWVLYASALLFVSRIEGIEQKLVAAERALRHAEPTPITRDLIGHIASIRASVGVAQNDGEAVVVQSRRALEYLHPDNLPVRTATIWTLGVAHQLQGERAAALRAFGEAIVISERIGHFIIHLLATLGVGHLQEMETELHLAAATYQQAVQMAGNPPLSVASEGYLGLARIHYQWNDLDAARHFVELGLPLAHQLESTGRFIAAELLLAQLEWLEGKAQAALARVAAMVTLTEEPFFAYQRARVVALQGVLLLRQGETATAAVLAADSGLPRLQARVALAQGDPATALALLEAPAQLAEARAWRDEQLHIYVLQTLAWAAQGEMAPALDRLQQALLLAEGGGLLRVFVDEGAPMARLVVAYVARGDASAFAQQVHAAFALEASPIPTRPSASGLIEPLSARELEVLQLIAQGLSNQEIGERLYLTLNTVKGHNQRIFDKLQVQRRTEAVARARALQLLDGR